MEQLWGIVIPEETTNLVKNPSIKVDTDGYTAVGSTIARDIDVQKFGPASLKVTPGSGSTAGAYFATVPSPSTNWITASCYFRGAMGIPYALTIATTAGSDLAKTEFVGKGVWQRVSVSLLEAGAGADRRIYFRKDGSADTDPFYVDAVQAEWKAYPTTYCDENQEGCFISTRFGRVGITSRDVNKSPGGRLYNFADLNLAVEAASGLGMPPSRHITQEYARLDGAEFQGRKVLPQTMQLIISAIGDDLSGLHKIRKGAIDAVKPDRQSTDKEFLLYYFGSDRDNPLEVRAVYDSGLEHHEVDGFSESMPVRFIAYDPIWCEVGEKANHIPPEKIIDPTGYVFGRVDGEWKRLSTGADEAARVFADAIDGRIIVAGAFTVVGGVSASRIALYNREADTFSALGAGLNGDVYDVVVDKNGDIIAVGAFTASGATSLLRLARWDWKAGTWNAVAGGADNTVRAIAFAPDGSIFIAGAFTEVGPIPISANRIARLLPDGSTWEALGTGLDDAGLALAIKDLGMQKDIHNFIVFVCGNFAAAGGVPGTTRVAFHRYIDGVGSWHSMRGGLSGTPSPAPSVMLLDRAGTLYVGGVIDLAGGVPVRNIGRWIGVGSSGRWMPTGQGTDSGVTHLGIFDDEGNITVGEGGLLPTTISQIWIWNGSTLMPHPVRIEDPDRSVTASLFSLGDWFGSSRHNGITVVPGNSMVVNPGTKSTYPKIVISAGADIDRIRLRLIENLRTGDCIYLGYDILAGETLTIHLDDVLKRVVSSFHGEVPWAVKRGGNLGTFRLLPGENMLNIQASGGAGGTLHCYTLSKICHWSADGAAK